MRTQSPGMRLDKPSDFRCAPRLNSRSIACMDLLLDEALLMARKGKLVVPPEKVRPERHARPVTVVMNISTPDASSLRASQGRIAAEAARAIERARRNL